MISILIAGDYSPMGRVQAAIDKGDFKAVFSEVEKFNASVDYSIVNFETTVADESDSPIYKCGPNLKCSAKSIEALRYAGFDMVTLANNHFYDYGDSSIEKSFAAIKTNGLDCVGAGINSVEASKTLYKNIKGKTVAFINCCEHEFSIATNEHGGCNPLNPIQQYYAIKEAKEKADYIIVIVHGGHEHFQLPSLRMKDTYRFFVDIGADAVVNHHQHCFSGYEFYKGKPIVYGLGNFCFDLGMTDSVKWHYGYAIELKLGEDVSIELHPYKQCHKDPEIRFLENRKDFDDKISELNMIIADDARLISEVEEYYKKSAKSYLSIFEPYNARYFKVAWFRGLLPSFFNDEKITVAMNYLNCESHLDKLRFNLTYKFNQHK